MLSHILGSHPEISGYGETWISYQTIFDLLKLRCVVGLHGNYKPGCTYFLDKILHDQLEIAGPVVEHSNIQYIFLIREPVSTVRSMVALHGKYAREGRSINPNFNPVTTEEALSHYARRLETLGRMGERLHRLRKRGTLVLGETLVHQPEAVLNELGIFLKLKSTLQEQYSLFARTGVWRHGDPSEFIRKGKIESRRPEHGEIAVPESPLLEKANRVYQETVSMLRGWFGCKPSATSGTAAAVK